MTDLLIHLLILVFVTNTLFAGWVVFSGGADWLWRALVDGARRRAWTPRKLRTVVASLWGVNAWALWVILEH
jgi:hypothetical protein